MSSMPSLKPRLVHLVKHQGANKFGFNVTATRSEPFRYVGIVVDNSLAKQSGLRSGDRVHEINGENVDSIPLSQVQGMISGRGEEVQLLVADPMTDQLYRDNSECIRSGLPETIYVRVGDDAPMENGQYEIPAEVVDADTFMNGHEQEDDLPIPPPITGDEPPRDGLDVEFIETPEIGEVESSAIDNSDIENAVVVTDDVENVVIENGDVENVVIENDDVENIVLENGDVENVVIDNGDVEGVAIENADEVIALGGAAIVSGGVENGDDPTVIAVSDEPSPFRARLCTVKKWADYKGYGFILHGDKVDPGQTIGKVEPGSPSEAAGLRAGDRLIEVNGQNVENDYQQDVVMRIANGPVAEVTEILVVDPDALRFFKGHGRTIHRSMADLDRIETPPRALVPAVAPIGKVRLCHVKKWADFSGFGFVLHGERGVSGTYLTNIDSGSPAEAAGLLDGDKIIEINGINVEDEEQPQAIIRIQTGVDGDTDQTKLLVVDGDSDRYFKRQNIRISGAIENVVYMTNPERTAPIVLSDPEPELPASQTSGPRARLCHMKKWSDYDGYGFYLNKNEGESGILIGNVDKDSPAESAGLRTGDLVIEVNGDNCEHDAQNDFVNKVVTVPSETRLLVVDRATYAYFLETGVLVNGNMMDVDVIEGSYR